MIQELAKRLIRQAEELQAQDIYILPRGTGYELLMRVGDDRRLIDVCESDRMANLISHFKFVAGMNVGEKRRCQLGACDYDLDDTKVSLRLSAVGDYQGQESLVIRLLYHHQRQLRYWFDGLERVTSAIGARGLYLFSGPVGSGKTTLMYQLVSDYCKELQVISIEDPVEIKK